MYNKQCRCLVNYFRKIIKKGELKSRYDVEDKSRLSGDSSSISDISYKIAGFDEYISDYRKSARKGKFGKLTSKIPIETEPESDIDGGQFKNRNVSNKKSAPYKSRSSKIRNIVSKRLRKAHRPLKTHRTPPPSTLSSYASFEDDCHKPQSTKIFFTEAEFYNFSVTKLTQDWLLPRKRKRVFLRNFRRCSVRYSSRRRKRKLKPCKSETLFSSTVELTPLRKAYSNNDVIDGGSCSEGDKARGRLFGRSLEDICDQNELPPKSILILLEDLSRRGPFEVGVFRKSGNARIVRELKASIENDVFISCNNIPVAIVASLFKEFLRSLPNCLFCCELYDQWLELLSYSSKEEKVRTIHHLCSRLPESHRILVKLVLYVLSLIAANSDENMMTSMNLGICVGPSILNSCKEDIAYTPKVSEVVSFMISSFEDVFVKNDRIYLERLLCQSLQKIDTDGYEEQSLSQVTMISEVNRSLDSGISSETGDNHCSDVTSSFDAINSTFTTPFSCVSLESNISISTDEVDKGNVSTDEVDIGNVSADEVDIGNVSADEVDIGNVSADEVDIGNVYADAVDIGNVYADAVDIGNVYADEVDIGNVSVDEVDIGNVSTDEVDIGNVFIYEVDKRPINQNFQRNCTTRKGYKNRNKNNNER